MIKVKNGKAIMDSKSDDFAAEIGVEISAIIVTYIQTLLEQSEKEDDVEREAEAAECLINTYLTVMAYFRDNEDVSGCTAMYAGLKEAVKIIDNDIQKSAMQDQIPVTFGAKVAGRSDN